VNAPQDGSAAEADPTAQDASDEQKNDLNDGSPPESEDAKAGSDPAAKVPANEDKQTQQNMPVGWFVGVASRSKKKTIREFNHQNRYDEWHFVYDPSTTHAGLLSGPSEPPLNWSAQSMGQHTSPATSGRE
jgi:hypothetical protein